MLVTSHNQNFSTGAECRERSFWKWLTGVCRGCCKGEREWGRERQRGFVGIHIIDLSLAHPAPLLSQLQSLLFVLRHIFFSVVFTWWSSSWTCPCWRWRKGAPSCWAGVGASWRGGGLGSAYWPAEVCSCRPELQYEKHCECSSLTWRLSTPSKPRLQAAWPKMNPAEMKEKMSAGQSKSKEGLVNGMWQKPKQTQERKKVDGERTCSWEIGACFWLDSSMRVHTSVRRSVLQPIRRIRVLGQKSWISAFHCKAKKQVSLHENKCEKRQINDHWGHHWE